MVYKPLKRGVETIADFPTKVIAVGKYFDPINVVGSGELDELMVLSPNTDFAVVVAVDGTTILSKTYAELNALTQSLRCVSAFPEVDEDGNPTGDYLAHIKGISFLVSLVARVANTGAVDTTFNIFGKYAVS
ncbi:MAG: hypothetical protein HWN51_06745 [Desulfobacterales bacterium]|nr:hypothetical protein [Desulfobacterales bacterium]